MCFWQSYWMSSPFQVGINYQERMGSRVKPGIESWQRCQKLCLDDANCWYWQIVIIYLLWSDLTQSLSGSGCGTTRALGCTPSTVPSWPPMATRRTTRTQLLDQRLAHKSPKMLQNPILMILVVEMSFNGIIPTLIGLLQKIYQPCPHGLLQQGKQPEHDCQVKELILTWDW